MFSGADASGAGADAKVVNPRFSIRWFTPVREVNVLETNLPCSCFGDC